MEHRGLLDSPCVKLGLGDFGGAQSLGLLVGLEVEGYVDAAVREHELVADGQALVETVQCLFKHLVDGLVVGGSGACVRMLCVRVA